MSGCWMSEAPEFILMAGANKILTEIAERHGFFIGARVPCATYGTIRFTDLDWKQPRRERYMSKVQELRPSRAVVPDILDESGFAETMSWAEEVSQYVEDVVVVPKCREVLKKIPEQINGARVVWGYSTPTPYGATQLFPAEFAGKPVHILGGNPRRQIELGLYFRAVAELVSLDNSVIFSMANRGKSFSLQGSQWQRVQENKDRRLWEHCAEASIVNLKTALKKAGLWRKE